MKKENKKNYNTPGLPVIDETIQDVGAYTRGYLSKNISVWSFVVCGVLLASLAVFVYILESVIPVMLFFAPLLVLPFFFSLTGRGHVRMIFMKQFAEANDFEFMDMTNHLLNQGGRKLFKKVIVLKTDAYEEMDKEIKGIMEQEKGSIMKESYSDSAYSLHNRAHNIILGSFMERPMRIFNYYRSGSTGTDSKHFYTVLSVHFERELPRMYLDAVGAGDERARDWAVGGLKRTSLESNEFERKYNLYITEGQQIPALQIFTPDFMASLIDMPEKFDIEFIEDRIYIYEPKLINTKRELQEMFHLAKYLIDNLNHVLKSMKYDAKV